MNKVCSIFLILLLSISTYIFADTTTRASFNTQAEFNGARVSSLGGTNPVLSGEVSSSFINPATLASIDSVPFSYTNKRLLGTFDYSVINLAVPFYINLPIKRDRLSEYRVTTGLSYGNSILKDIPKTLYSVGEIWETETYVSGFEYIQSALATNLYDLFGFNEIGLGTSFKYIRQYVGTENKGTFSFDTGLILSKYIGFYFLDSFHLGVSAQNLLARPIVWSHSDDPTTTANEGRTNEVVLPLKVYSGLKLDLFNEKLSLYLNNASSGIAISSEYYFRNNIILRGSYEGTKLNLGTGIMFPNIYGFNQQEYRFRMDYNYSQNQYPLDADPSHSLSLSILGSAKPKPPFIIFPDELFILTNSQYYDLLGNAEKKTDIQIFRNNIMIKTAQVNRFGEWQSRDFPLKEGMNDIFVKSYEISKDLSRRSNKIKIYLDTTPPELNLSIAPGKDRLELVASSNEQLAEVTAVIGTSNITFQEINKVESDSPYIMPNQDSFWKTVAKLPDDLKDGSRVPTKMTNIIINAMDLSGNESQSIAIPFFVELKFPKDKFVHYKENIRLIGYSSPIVEGLEVDGNPIYIDPSNRFAITTKLEPGKNLVNLTVKTLNNKRINYNFRVLRLVSFDDLTDKTKFRREIEFLSTLGVISGDDDGNFYPEKKVSRDYITKLLVDSDDELEPELVRDDLFEDVPADHPYASYISTAVNNGLMFAFPDGTFKPEQPLTMSEIVFLLSSAGIIDAQEVDDENKLINRNELAQFLAYTPFYERKIERLINWEIGYDKK
ncbi:hypothetical protein DID75_01780 [Candidatus Marinamargulisbacteria bacterium SCGC AG-410-N11]|nr:hypothetical protein DID75_01780 [Candidatus Marinamargulisbacteria bacterium SCGC AG-410-N11]